MKIPRIPFPLGFAPHPRPAARLFQSRWTHSKSKPSLVPTPIPFVPDVQTFLTVIGRDLSQHATKFPTWEALFSLTSPQLKELGIEPPRTRKYLLRWLQRFRLGQFGAGGDFRYVENGVARLKVMEIYKNPIFPKKFVVNVPAEKAPEELPEEERIKAEGYCVQGARQITGPYAIPLKTGEGSAVTVTAGMWEDKRGRKIDGGERRQAQVRFLRRAAERRAEKEKLGLH